MVIIDVESRFLTEREKEDMGFFYLGKHTRITRSSTITDPKKVSVGDYTLISDHSLLTGWVTIGDWCHIAHYVHLSGGTEGIFIGDFVGVGSRSTMYTENDDYYGEAMWTPAPEKYKKVDKGSIKIGNHVLIGWNSMVFPGVAVPSYTIFGARSMLKGRYFGESLFTSEGNKTAQFRKDLPTMKHNMDILRKALYEEPEVY